MPFHEQPQSQQLLSIPLPVGPSLQPQQLLEPLVLPQQRQATDQNDDRNNETGNALEE
jgi:hypothetical protein